jgi:RNA polymerase sigma-70 factor (ECF subfamily)
MAERAEQGGSAGSDRPIPSASGDPSTGTTLTIAQVIERYHQAVYRYAFRLTGRQADAEDLTQQTFLIAQQKLGQLRDVTKVDRWLFAVLRSRFSKNRSRRGPVFAGSMEMDMDAMAIEPPPSDEVDRELLARALNELPDDFRVVLVMYYFEDASYKEIAQQLAIPIGTVMSRLARAKQRLREQLVLLGAESH